VMARASEARLSRSNLRAPRANEKRPDRTSSPGADSTDTREEAKPTQKTARNVRAPPTLPTKARSSTQRAESVAALDDAKTSDRDARVQLWVWCGFVATV